MEFKYFSFTVCSIQSENCVTSVKRCGYKLAFVDHVRSPFRTGDCERSFWWQVKADPLRFCRVKKLSKSFSKLFPKKFLQCPVHSDAHCRRRCCCYLCWRTSLASSRLSNAMCSTRPSWTPQRYQPSSGFRNSSTIPTNKRGIGCCQHSTWWCTADHRRKSHAQALKEPETIYLVWAQR